MFPRKLDRVHRCVTALYDGAQAIRRTAHSRRIPLKRVMSNGI